MNFTQEQLDNMLAEQRSALRFHSAVVRFKTEPSQDARWQHLIFTGENPSTWGLCEWRIPFDTMLRCGCTLGDDCIIAPDDGLVILEWRGEAWRTVHPWHLSLLTVRMEASLFEVTSHLDRLIAARSE